MAGPDRPIPQNEPASKLERPGLGSPASSSVSDALAATSGVGSDLYNRLGAAISERGQMLDGLEDTVGSLQQGSSNMLAQVGFLGILMCRMLISFVGEKIGFRAVDEKLVQPWLGDPGLFLLYDNQEHLLIC